MSWMKRPQGGVMPPGSDHQPYAASQPYGNQQNMYPNYQGAQNVQQQPMWQMPQQQAQYNQQHSQTYQQQQNYGNNANQLYQQQPQQINPNYANQNYDNMQHGYQQNYYQNQPPQQQQSFSHNEGNTDNWEDNWGWGWEDGSKQHQRINQSSTQVAPLPQQAFENANIIEESFAPSNSWNWSMEGKKESKDPSETAVDNQILQPPIDNTPNQSNDSNIQPKNSTTSNNIQPDVTHLSDKEVIKERMPNLATGKRIHLENLTPQWSIESQMSQESSDGPQTHSEGTYRSENQSRNSSKSSPGPNTDSSNFNYSQAEVLDTGVSNSEWSKHSTNESVTLNTLQNDQRREIHEELANSMHEMSLGNHEHPTNINNKISNSETVRKNSQQFDQHPAATSSEGLTFSSLQAGLNSAPTEPSPLHIPSTIPVSAPQNAMPPLLPPTGHTNMSSSTLPPPPPSFSPISVSNITQTANNVLQPPTKNFPPAATQNPFKHAGPFSHKSTNKVSTNPFPSQGPASHLTSPLVVNQFIQQDTLSGNYGANLETTPDNSERPDQPAVTGYRNMPDSHSLPDNLEIAPQNDRNEYLQTAHLSSGDFGENTDFSRNLPPSTLRRMGVGQQDVEYTPNLNISGDEPPPGLSRMVPGQQTETSNSYNQPGDDYMDRQIDGQPTDISGHPYRQADGQQTPDSYAQQSSNRSSDRRPIGLDRMVPGEPSNEEYIQYPTGNFNSTNEQRVVTGLDHDFPVSVDISSSNVRTQNLDGSDYIEPPRNSSRNIIGAREASNATSPEFNISLEDQQREIIMEGENLQDLNVGHSNEITNISNSNKDVSHDPTDAIDYPQTSSRRQSLNRITSGEDSERDRTYKDSPRRDRDKHRSSRDHDRERDKEGRYSRGDRKYEKEERRSARDDRQPERERRDRDRTRRERDQSPDMRRQRRSTRSHRYETEDTDYYSDREREHRRYREGSYSSSKPPRPDDKDRRYDDRDRSRRYNTIERDRRYDDERDGASRTRRSERHREKFERRYRDIDPARKYGSRRDEDERRKVVTFCGDTKTESKENEGETYSSGSRAGSREATATDEEGEPRRARRRRAREHHAHHYREYGAAGYGEAYEATRRQYEYYERLRRTDPAAYMRLYKQLMDPAYAHKYYDGYGGVAYPGREERGSVHSGRSSDNGLKHTDTAGWRGGESLCGAPSLRTCDLSDRELTTDMSLNLQLEDSTVRSERMTPFKFSTSHIKGTFGASCVVVSGGCGGGGGGGARVVPLWALARAPAAAADAAELAALPGPLVKGVTHKKSVIEYCRGRARGAAGADRAGRALLWDLLALLLTQNGVVVGSDIAELLMKNMKEFEFTTNTSNSGARRDCSGAGSPPPPAHTALEEEPQPAIDQKEALDRFREYLIYGNRQEALEWAMSSGLWAHALQLAALGERSARAAVMGRFLQSLPAADTLHTLYATLASRVPPAAACAGSAECGDWRPHAAMLLANPSARPEHDVRTLLQLGESLWSRGLWHSATAVYLAAGERPARHPLAPLRPAPAPPAPPRVSLLLAPPHPRSLHQLATTEAIFATEVYEYALSLTQDYVNDELVVYKVVLACRLWEAGVCARALAYVRAAARALARAPHRHAPRLLTVLAELAERWKYSEPGLEGLQEADAPGEDGDSASSSPRHWLSELRALAAHCAAQTEAGQAGSPQHAGGWPDQTLQQDAFYPEAGEEAVDYSSHYYQPPAAPYQPPPPPAHEPGPRDSPEPGAPPALGAPPEPGPAAAPDWPRPDDHEPTYAEQYNWLPDNHYGYNEGGAPTITMPGAARSRPYPDFGDERPHSAPQPTRETETPKQKEKEEKSSDSGKGGKGGKSSGWLGGILTKLSLRPPNQMILPDDSDPAIVWDEQHKCWRDTGADEGGAGGPPGPPPAGPPPSGPPLVASPAGLSGPAQSPAGGNIYKLQKSRNIKKAYVDVFAGAAPAPPPATYAPPPAPSAVEVYISSTPEDSPRPTPTPPLDKGNLYDPTQMAVEDDVYKRSAI